MKSSIEYLINEVSAILGDTHLNSMQYLLLADALKKAREMHKTETMNAFLEGKVNHSKDWAQDYYNKTYNQNQ